MNVRLYQSDRAQFSAAELSPYDGKWVAFSADGSQILASAADLLSLDRQLVEAGEDPEQLGIERIVLDDSSMAGSELL